jgi:dTDP-glucose pyrophosphorylase
MPMNTLALVMAGGQGQRMRRSAIERAKPLVEVRGVPLLERNVRMLLRHGFGQIVIAAPCSLPEIRRFADDRCKALGRAAGASIEVLVEERPLGNIGCAGLLRHRAANVLVVYADNLTTLDLASVLQAHLATNADLTLAVHDEPFQVPFGRVQVEGRRVVVYEEKPTLFIPVCSAVSVLGLRAMAFLPTDRPTGLSELTQTMIAASAGVLAYRHEAPWVDVNDSGMRQRAEELVLRHQDSFELWWPSTGAQRLVLVLRNDKDEILFASGPGPSPLELPHTSLRPRDSPEQVARHLGADYGVQADADWCRVAAFDDLDPGGDIIARTIVMSSRTGAAHHCQGVWVPCTEDKLTIPEIELSSRRALAISGRRLLTSLP